MTMGRRLDGELGSLADRLLVEAGGEELEPMIRCPRWHSCSAPICPLDPQKELRVGLVEDEERCTLPKAKRVELGALLPWRGLWPREIASMEKWARMTDEQRGQLQAASMQTRFGAAVGDE